jgi:hypothetical protein
VNRTIGVHGKRGLVRVASAPSRQVTRRGDSGCFGLSLSVAVSADVPACQSRLWSRRLLPLHRGGRGGQAEIHEPGPGQAVRVFALAVQEGQGQVDAFDLADPSLCLGAGNHAIGAEY